MFNELPPMLNGTEKYQLTQLREYLVRLVRGIGHSDTVEGGQGRDWSGAIRREVSSSAETINKRIVNSSNELKRLITSAISTCRAYTDSKISELGTVYTALSVFNSFKNSADAKLNRLNISSSEDSTYLGIGKTPRTSGASSVELPENGEFIAGGTVFSDRAVVLEEGKHYGTSTQMDALTASEGQIFLEINASTLTVRMYHDGAWI